MFVIADNIRSFVISIVLPKSKQIGNSLLVNFLTLFFGAISGILLLISTGNKSILSDFINCQVCAVKRKENCW